jgi:hypothetical protein
LEVLAFPAILEVVEMKWSALADDFRTLLMSDEGYESVFQQFMA